MKKMKLTIYLVATLFLTLGINSLASAQDSPLSKVLNSGADPIGIGKEDQTIYKFDIILDEGFDNSKDVLDVVPAEFDVIEEIIPPCGAVETYEPRKNKKKNGLLFNLMRPKLNPDFILWDLDCSDHPDGDCTACENVQQILTVSIGTDLNPGHAWHPFKIRTPIYEPTECGPLVINEGAVLIGSDDEEVDNEPSNSLVVATCLVQGDETVCIDGDEDGWSVDCGDCNDDDSTVNPGVIEVCADGIDNDCDGEIDEVEPEICDDDIDNDCDGTIDEDEPEVCDDRIDNDCDGLIDAEDPDCLI
jgi:hypothetical protein